MNKKKRFLKYANLILIIILLMPSKTIANVINENENMDDEQLIISNYLVDNGDSIKFDLEAAIEDNVDEHIINSGRIFNKLIGSRSNEIVGLKGKTIPIWGNCCGPSYGSGQPIDKLDYGCIKHDICYVEKVYHKCYCDDEFLKYIINNKNGMTGGQRDAANAIEEWLRIKLNHPEKYGNFSCAW